MQNKASLFILLSAASFAGFFWLKDFLKLRNVPNAQPDPWPGNQPQPFLTVTAATAQVRDWAESVEVTGPVVAGQGVTIGTGAAGVVETIHFESGQVVKQGELLVALDARIEKALLRELEAQASLAEEVSRRFDSGQQDAIQTHKEQKRLEFEVVRARVQAQLAQIEQKLIRAPFDGELGLCQVNLGQYLPVGSPLVILTNLNPIHVDFTLPEQYIDRVSVGQAVTAHLEGKPRQVFPGYIHAVIPEIHQETRHFRVRAVFDNPGRVLVPGLLARIEWSPSTPERRVVMIPRSAVLEGAVFVIESAPPGDATSPDSPRLIATRRHVQLGPPQGDLVVVLEGLQANERVAISNLHTLKDGQIIVVV